ncbi:MAG: fibronectin type III domain-containing protein [Candidatus Uhrbacteria bacterium]|nr:fibronectin type III domain-containing protein [Candidatus Uhrbacteria bacterium]
MKSTTILLLIFAIFALTQSALAASTGDLLTCPDSKAVYKIQDDSTRWVFPNSATFFTWYSDFDDVHEIDCSELAQHSLAGVMTYAPNSRLVKIQSDNKVYSVAEGGVLHWVQTEADATERYGSAWSTLIDDVDVGIWPSYSVGSALDKLEVVAEINEETDVAVPDLVSSAPVVVSNESYTIDWSTITNVSSYTFQEDDNADFSSPTSTEFELEDETKLVVTKSVSRNQAYYYRIQSRISGRLSDWSNTVQVIVQPLLILDGVPDINQPPLNSFRASITNGWSAPMAAANIFEYFDDAKNEFATNITGTSSDQKLGDYLGWFMDTNNYGSSERRNSENLGTLNSDIASGMQEFAIWDGAHPSDYGFPTTASLIDKDSYTGWTFSTISGSSAQSGAWTRIKNQLKIGSPALVVFDYWNPNILNKVYNDINLYSWGSAVESSKDSNIGTNAPIETWNSEQGNNGVGHAVTAVGYIENYDADDGNGEQDWIIVHDTWPTTPNPLAIPWDNFSYAVLISPNESTAPTGKPNLSSVSDVASGETIVLSWDRQIAATYYEIEWDTSSTFSENPSSYIAAIGNQIFEYETSRTVSANTTYYYRIRAMNDFGTGDWSDKLSILVYAP